MQIGEETIKLGLICYSADNLEASAVGGFSQCFSSLDVCRVCHQQYNELQEISGIAKAAPWTREEYDAAVEDMDELFDSSDDEEAPVPTRTYNTYPRTEDLECM